MVAGAALLSWLTLIVRLRLARPGAAEPAGHVGVTLRGLVKLSALVATQSLIQLSLFFALPLYVAAAALDIGHLCFLSGLALLAGLALWDPWTERLLTRPALGLLLPALSSFAALNAVLPGLGLANRHALWVAAALSSLATLATSFGHHALRAHPRRSLRYALPVAILPALLATLGARLIPAAPMRMVAIEFGTQVADHWVADPVRRLRRAPATLVCATAIFAPAGVHERLVHVWSVDGIDSHRVPLDIRGGRGAGFRTYSRIRRPRDHARWRCRVQTQSGQLLGASAIDID